MLKGFVGVKPQLGEVAKMMKVWGDQMGYDYESAKDLFDIQSQFPPLFKKLADGLLIIDNINSSSGKTITKGQQQQLTLIKDQVIAFGMLNGASTNQMESAIAALTPLTAEERKYNEILSARAELSKTAANLQLDFATKFEPLQKDLLKVATVSVDKMHEYKDVAIGVGITAAAVGGLSSAIQTATTIAKAFGNASKAAMGWVGLAITGAAALASYLSYRSSQRTDAEENAKAIALDLQAQAERESQISKLTGIRRQEYEKLMAAGKKEGETLAETNARHKDIWHQVNAEGAETIILAKQYEEIKTTIVSYEKAFDASRGSLQALVSTSEEFGLQAKDALELLKGIANLSYKTAMEGFTKSVKIAAKMLEGKGFKLNVTGNYDEMSASLKEALQYALSLNDADVDKKNIIAQITMAMKEQNGLTSKQADITKAIIADNDSQIRQQEKFTSAYEARLDSERKLMESAQFGLGASVEMMQKQVDLAYQLQQTYADADKNYQKFLKDQKIASDIDIKRIQNAQTQAEAENYIKNVMKATQGEAQLLSDYAVKHQEYSKKTMEQQQKIYDLTKDIREGYLDAIREMATGAGEFEKIIGTQDMGVTQLMNSVKDVTGVAKLNTMALGGLQNQILTNQGVGKEYAGQYTAGGISMIGGATQEGRNRRIYGYDDSVSRANAIRRGDVPGQSGRSRVGQMNVPGAENYLGPQREAQVIGDETHDGAKEGIIEGMKYMAGINKGVWGGRFNRGEVSKIRAEGRSSGNLGAGYLGGSTPPYRAGGGARRSSTGEGLDVGNIKEYAMWQEEVIKNQEKIERQQERVRRSKGIWDEQVGGGTIVYGQRTTNAGTTNAGTQTGIFTKAGKWQNKARDSESVFRGIQYADSQQALKAKKEWESSNPAPSMVTGTSKSPSEKEMEMRRKRKEAEDALVLLLQEKYSARKDIAGTSKSITGTKGKTAANRDILDEIASAEGAFIDKAKKGELSPLLGLGALGLASNVYSGVQGRKPARMYKKWDKVGKNWEKLGANLAKGKDNIIERMVIEARYKAQGENQIANLAKKNADKLSKAQKSAKFSKGMGSVGGMFSGIGGGLLFRDVANMLGAEEGGAVQTGAEIAGGIGGMLGASNPYVAPALVGYAAGRGLDVGVEKLTGYSMSGELAKGMQSSGFFDWITSGKYKSQDDPSSYAKGVAAKKANKDRAAANASEESDLDRQIKEAKKAVAKAKFEQESAELEANRSDSSRRSISEIMAEVRSLDVPRQQGASEADRTRREEISYGAEEIRRKIGKVKPKKGQTQGDAEFKAATNMFMKENVDLYGPEADFQKNLAMLEEIKKQRKPLSQKEINYKSAYMEGDPTKRKGFSSAAEAQGYQASAEDMQVYQERSSQIADIYGGGGGGGEGGGGSATILVRLDKGLTAVLENAIGVSVEVQQGASR
jgi:hypothetical protein